MILGLFSRRDRPAVVAAAAAYPRIVAQAREPAFYRDLGVPDTVMGRFEMIVLHAFLYVRRMTGAGPEAAEAAQETFDLMFRDLDDSLREIGIGDLSVPKKIKAMAQSFYGRAEVYEAALASPDDDALIRALARNVHGDETAAGPAQTRLAAYVHRAAGALADQPLPVLLAAGPSFPAVEEPAP